MQWDRYNHIIEELTRLRDRKCIKESCADRELKLRSTPPRTAYKPDVKYFDYWQCPKCKVNYAFPKKGVA